MPKDPKTSIARCLIVEDHEQAQRWLTRAVDLAFPSVQIVAVGSIGKAQQVSETEPPFDLALLDIGLPDGNGLDLINPLISLGADVVISSIYEDEDHLFEALQLGATGYLLKDHPVEEIVPLLRGIVIDGKPPLSPRIARRILSFFSRPAARVPAKPAVSAEHSVGGASQLTPRERDVLTLLAKGYSIPSVGELLEISPHTASGYTKNIYKKLNVTSRAEAALEATRFGLVDPER